jgi:hypothetical protein
MSRSSELYVIKIKAVFYNHNLHSDFLGGVVVELDVEFADWALT